MGTRGVIGTLRNKVLHAAYQQFDTYPTSTGVELQKEMQSRIDWTVEQEITADDLFTHLGPLVDKMSYVDSGAKPTPDEMTKFADSLDTRVSTGDDWYALLRKHQGSLMKRLEAGIATDDPAFVKDSLFCEWGYIFDFDDEKVIILRGFNNRKEAQWVHARLDAAAVKAAKAKAKRFEGNEPYYGVSVLWTGTMAEFLAADMTAIEALEVDA